MSLDLDLELEPTSTAIRSKAAGPSGQLPLTEDLLLHSPSGDVFGFSQDAGMGWDPKLLNGGQVLILSTSGGLRAEDGTPIALGFHTGHWELNLLVRRVAEELKALEKIPFAAYCSDPCDGRTQGTSGMLDSLPYRNTAAEAFGRLIRSLPNRRSLIGIATCDKGLPAMMMALAEAKELPGILIPGGVTLPPISGEDAGTIQSIGSRFAHGEISLEQASAMGCSACASPGGGCQFLGTAASSQVVGEALGLSLPHSALVPSGEPVWLQLAKDSARAVVALEQRGIKLKDILTKQAFSNALAVHAAFGGSTNLLLHIPAIAFMAGVERPTIKDWIEINKKVPRLVDALPNGPKNYKTAQVYLAGAVPEVMLKLRELGVLHLDALTASGKSLGENLQWWESSERRKHCQQLLREQDAVDPAEVIYSLERAASSGLSSTVIFPQGNITPEGSVVKSTAISSDLCPGGIYQHTGPARVFTSENAAIAALKSTDEDRLKPGEIIVLICRGPLGAGMPETAQITNSLKYTKALSSLALITDGRFSGFSSGPCIGHIGPEALAGGPIGRIEDGDIISIYLDRNNLEGTVNLVGSKDTAPSDYGKELGDKLLNSRKPRSDLKADPSMPAATKLWAHLQQAGGGTWGGCVYDCEAIIKQLQSS